MTIESETDRPSQEQNVVFVPKPEAGARLGTTPEASDGRFTPDFKGQTRPQRPTCFTNVRVLSDSPTCNF